MSHTKTLTLSVAALGLMAGTAFAGQEGGANFTSHHLTEDMPYERYVEDLPAERKLEMRNYLAYQDREPCQNYQQPPQGFVKMDCMIVPEAALRDEEEMRIIAVEPASGPETYSVLTDYEVHFGFDSAEVNGDAARMLDKVAREIGAYGPSEVTVAGHADTAGPAGYNERLSQRRAEAISEALTQRGVVNRVIEKRAYGEQRPEVETGDGVALRENRRVEIEFRKEKTSYN